MQYRKLILWLISADIMADLELVIMQDRKLNVGLFSAVFIFFFFFIHILATFVLYTSSCTSDNYFSFADKAVGLLFKGSKGYYLRVFLNIQYWRLY